MRYSDLYYAVSLVKELHMRLIFMLILLDNVNHIILHMVDKFLNGD